MLIPRCAVMRLLNSAVMRVWGNATSASLAPWRWYWIGGSDASSATAGSSIVTVVGKTRLPATPWAKAPAERKSVEHATTPVVRKMDRNIERFLVESGCRRRGTGRSTSRHPQQDE